MFYMRLSRQIKANTCNPTNIGVLLRDKVWLNKSDSYQVIHTPTVK